MSSASSSASASRDLQRFFKFFTQKAVQVIVQSRQGQLFRTPSKPSAAGQDWFYLFIDDDVDLSVSTKEALRRSPMKAGRAAFCVEISANSSEEDVSCVLEQWSITITEKPSPRFTAMTSDNVYLKLGLLLRSLIAVSRTLPAYHLSKSRQEDLSMSYRIFSNGIPKKEQLGSGKPYVCRLVVGSVATPLGCCSIQVNYAKELTFTPSIKTASIPIHLEEKREDVDGKCEKASPSSAQASSVESNGDVLLPFCATQKKLPRHPSIESQTLCEDVPFAALLKQAKEPKANREEIEEETIVPPSTSTRFKSAVEPSIASEFELLDLEEISTPFASGTERAVLDFYRKMQATAALPFCQHKTPEVVSKEDLIAELARMKKETESVKDFIESL
ncbi:autophagy-related protein 13 homolog isoform X2 [Oscarella lobularis]|uniref:autophagy-related protein 13 homolog isoform X2 n=1 Tax=Oscarella lobularis TaxID=121494 RepID=UPI0033131D21